MANANSFDVRLNPPQKIQTYQCHSLILKYLARVNSKRNISSILPKNFQNSLRDFCQEAVNSYLQQNSVDYDSRNSFFPSGSFFTIKILDNGFLNFEPTEADKEWILEMVEKNLNMEANELGLRLSEMIDYIPPLMPEINIDSLSGIRNLVFQGLFKLIFSLFFHTK